MHENLRMAHAMNCPYKITAGKQVLQSYLMELINLGTLNIVVKQMLLTFHICYIMCYKNESLNEYR
jgi:hypothetical protein